LSERKKAAWIFRFKLSAYLNEAFQALNEHLIDKISSEKKKLF